MTNSMRYTIQLTNSLLITECTQQMYVIEIVTYSIMSLTGEQKGTNGYTNRVPLITSNQTKNSIGIHSPECKKPLDIHIVWCQYFRSQETHNSVSQDIKLY